MADAPEDDDLSPHRSQFVPKALAFRDCKLSPASMKPEARCSKGLSLVARLTLHIKETYQACNPTFSYSESFNPKRILTRPSVGVANDGFDNANSDLILAVNTVLHNVEAGHRYVVKDMLGQGTFGQVAKCYVEETGEYVAVKVIKNQPAYYHQAFVEISVLKMLNQHYDPDDQHHIVRLLDHFVHEHHLCLVFELLTYNLFELIKQNQFRGLSMNLVRLFLKQILNALAVLRDGKVIHCDLKPENILLKSLQSGEIKLIDFGSACMENRTVYSYIQSRFYRSPEVLLQHPYTTAIDMWSLGCVAAELFLGLPLFPGASEYNLLSRMIETLGAQPPDHVLRAAKNTSRFFKRRLGGEGVGTAHRGAPSQYAFLAETEFEAREKSKPAAGKRYFKFTKLEDIIINYSIKRGSSTEEIEAERRARVAFTDFLLGLLEFDPAKRWTPRQAVQHPFLTDQPFRGAWQPPPELARVGVSQGIQVPHNPQRGHWSAVGLSPQVPGMGRSQLSPQRAPASHMVNSLGSLGSYSSTYGESMALGSSYGSYGETNAGYLNFPTPPCPPHGALDGTGPRRFLHIPGRGSKVHASSPRTSSAYPSAMSLGVSPSQFTPPYGHSFPSSSYAPTSPEDSPSVGYHPAVNSMRCVVPPQPGGEHWSHAGYASSVGKVDMGVDLSAGLLAWQRGSRPELAYHGRSPPAAAQLAGSPQGAGLQRRMLWGQQPSKQQQPLSTWGSGAGSASVHETASEGGEDMSPPPDPGDWDPYYSDELLLGEEGALPAGSLVPPGLKGSGAVPLMSGHSYTDLLAAKARTNGHTVASQPGKKWAGGPAAHNQGGPWVRGRGTSLLRQLNGSAEPEPGYSAPGSRWEEGSSSSGQGRGTKQAFAMNGSEAAAKSFNAMSQFSPQYRTMDAWDRQR